MFKYILRHILLGVLRVPWSGLKCNWKWLFFFFKLERFLFWIWLYITGFDFLHISTYNLRVFSFIFLLLVSFCFCYSVISFYIAIQYCHPRKDLFLSSYLGMLAHTSARKRCDYIMWYFEFYWVQVVLLRSFGF